MGRGATVACLTVNQVEAGSTPVCPPKKISILHERENKNMKLYRYSDLVPCNFVTSIYCKTGDQVKAEKARKRAEKAKAK